MDAKYFDLRDFFEGYVKNYRRLNIYQSSNRSMFTKREVDYFRDLGEMLGFYTFVEDYKPNTKIKRSRPMDLAWWKSDDRQDEDNFLYLVLHLERENVFEKDVETIEKLFAITDKEHEPCNVIGIQNIENEERIIYLNSLVKKKNKIQNSNALMIYRFYDSENEFDRVYGYYFEGDNLVEERKAVSKVDDTGYWTMYFKE